MTGQEIIDQLRIMLDDVEVPYLWPDAELLRYANEAEREACRRALLIKDRTTSADSGTKGICSLSLGSGTADYTLSPLVIQILRVKLPSDAAASSAGTAGYGSPLQQYTRDEMDDIAYDWENLTGTPEAFISEAGNELQIIPIPTFATTAKLIVYRLPLVDFTDATSPEIHSQYHFAMVDWALHLAYIKNDSDTLNGELSKYHAGKFELSFGGPVNFRDLAMRKSIARLGQMRARVFGS
jgi:hypothetical protein